MSETTVTVESPAEETNQEASLQAETLVQATEARVESEHAQEEAAEAVATAEQAQETAAAAAAVAVAGDQAILQALESMSNRLAALEAAQMQTEETIEEAVNEVEVPAVP